MKKILILTVTAGSAHNVCAKNIKAKLEGTDGEAAVKVVDLMSYSSKRNAWIADRGYNIAVSRFPKLYNAFYRRYRRAKPYKRYSCPPRNTVLSLLDGLLREILAFEPDVIVCTHFYGAIALTGLRLVYPLPCKVFAVTLDYVNSPFWEAGIGVDFLTLPNGDFMDAYHALGYRGEQLLPLGIPVDERTLFPKDKREAKRELGLDETVPTVAVMFGGGHWGGGFRIFKQLLRAIKDRKAQVIMLNGRDGKSFRRIERIRTKKGMKILNVGYTDDVPLYLSAVDIAINKCGGGSSTETVNSGVPMLVTEALPAQEAYNLDYLKEKGVALSFKNGGELKTQLLRLLDDAGLREKMSANTLPLRKNAIADLAQRILLQPNADYGDFLEIVLLNGNDLRAEKHVRKALKEESRKARRRARCDGRVNKF